MDHDLGDKLLAAIFGVEPYAPAKNDPPPCEGCEVSGKRDDGTFDCNSDYGACMDWVRWQKKQ